MEYLSDGRVVARPRQVECCKELFVSSDGSEGLVNFASLTVRVVLVLRQRRDFRTPAVVHLCPSSGPGFLHLRLQVRGNFGNRLAVKLGELLAAFLRRQLGIVQQRGQRRRGFFRQRDAFG